MGTSMKEDEKRLLKALANSKEEFPALRDIGPILGIHPKRVNYLACKWSEKGFYDWGVCADLGWLTDQGKKWAEDLGLKR